jgi:1-acyl-sn-glycerol-3-phosphate acyltransferase
MTKDRQKSMRAILARPEWPGTIERPAPERRLGAFYDTSWARRPAARLSRAVVLDTVSRPLLWALAAPDVLGEEHLARLDGPAIFAANHTSHLDTAIVLSALPPRVRHRCVVMGAADYFFDRPWKAALWAFFGTIPIERSRVNRRGPDVAAGLLEDGWSVVIFPEGGRSPDGWAQEFRGVAAYLAKRCDVPVVPVHLHGVRPILAKGSSRPRPGKVAVRFGTPLWPRPASGAEGGRAEDVRRFSARIEQAVAVLADEAATDWWSARRRAALGVTPDPRGPDAAPWRRAWVLPEHARNDVPRRRLGPAKPW